MSTDFFPQHEKPTLWAYRLPDLTRAQAIEIVFRLLAEEEGNFTAHFDGEDHDIALYVTSSLNRAQLDEKMLEMVVKVRRGLTQPILLLTGPDREPGVG